jgi:hypothetical protein
LIQAPEALMNPSKTWLAASVCMVGILAAALVTAALEATRPDFEQDALQCAIGCTEEDGDTLATDEHSPPRPAAAAEAVPAVSEPVPSMDSPANLHPDIKRVADFVEHVRRSRAARTRPAHAAHSNELPERTAMPDAVKEPEEMKQLVAEGLARIGRVMVKLRRPVHDAKQLIQWALGIGHKRGQMAAG